jgi:micrococcal nuclease
VSSHDEEGLPVFSIGASREQLLLATRSMSRRPFRVGLAAIACCAAAAVCLGQPAFEAKVVGLADGDTISVMRDGKAVTVRIFGIDCPENAQDFSTKAKQFTSSKVFGKTVTIMSQDIDRYGRTVARVMVDREDLGLALVRAGLAWHYTRYSNDAELALAETAARAAKRGIWSHARPIPPWEYRRPAPVAGAEGPFHGNVRSLVFHRVGCPHYDCQNCTRVFTTRAEGLAAGFRPAGDCLK